MTIYPNSSAPNNSARCCPVPPPPPCCPPPCRPGTAGNGLAAYGGLYNATTQLLFFTQADTYLPVSLNTPMSARNVAYPAANSLMVAEPGTTKSTTTSC